MNEINSNIISQIVEQMVDDDELLYSLAESLAQIIIRVLADEGIIDRG